VALDVPCTTQVRRTSATTTTRSYAGARPGDQVPIGFDVDAPAKAANRLREGGAYNGPTRRGRRGRCWRWFKGSKGVKDARRYGQQSSL